MCNLLLNVFDIKIESSILSASNLKTYRYLPHVTLYLAKCEM